MPYRFFSRKRQSKTGQSRAGLVREDEGRPSCPIIITYIIAHP